ncbi:MAG: DUF5985 family protein [Deltaproteobacteria bacterium]|nr:DUF5985 family protein [Deltaproteobacteria bacterium]
MAELVYFLCAATSIGCAILLFRGYRRSQTRLLFWSSLCFMGLALNNALLLVDLVIVPEVDLSTARSGVALVAMMVLLFGLVWESR